MRNAIHSADVMRQRTAAEDQAAFSIRQGYRPCLDSCPPSRSFLLRKMRKNCGLTTVFFLLILVLGLSENLHLRQGRYAYTSLSEGLRILIIALTIPQVLLIIQIHKDVIALKANADEVHPCSIT